MDSIYLGDSISSLIELFTVQESLYEKLRILRAQLALKDFKNEDNIDSISDDNLEVEIAQGLKKLKKAQNNNLSKNKIVKMTLFSQEAFKSAYKNQSKLNENDLENSFHLHGKISLKLDNLQQMSKQFIERHKQSFNLKLKLTEAEKRLQVLQWKTRDIFSLVNQCTKVSDKSVFCKAAEEKNKKIKEQRESLEIAMKRLKLRKAIFLGLIHASKLDWYGDEELRELVLSLNDPI